jgi:predicted nucleic-acid-binding protein
LQIVDTVVILAFLDKEDSRFDKASAHIQGISLRQDILVPSATMLELDLELKTHGVDDAARVEIHARLATLIPSSRVLPLTSEILGRAAGLSKGARWRGSYFDTMIAATGLEYGADSAITTDRKFSQLGLRVTF